MTELTINNEVFKLGQNVGLCTKSDDLRNGFRREYFGPIVRITETHLYLKNLILPIDSIFSMWDNWRNETDSSAMKRMGIK